MKTTIKPICTLLVSTWLLAGTISCTGDDYYYKELIEGKDLVHPGKISDLNYSSGHNRFALDFVLARDPQVNAILIFWNNRADSLIFAVEESEIGQTKQIIVENLAEDTYDIEVFSRNIHGVKSVPTRTVGRVYGERYISSLNNRVYLQGGFSGGRAWVEWIPETREEYVYTKITYTTPTGVTTVELPRGTEWRYIDDYIPGTRVYFQAAFRPLENTLDTYFSAEDFIVLD